MMLRQHFLIIVFLLSLAVPLLVALETCPASGMPGIPGIPGLPGRDGRDGAKGDTGEPGAQWSSGLGPQKGQTGDPGSRGHQGKLGQSGERGKPGSLGTEGLPGDPGEPGTVGLQQQAAFSVARGTIEFPEKASLIVFKQVITNIHDDYNTNTGQFRCRVPGMYYFVFHASLEEKLCVLLKLDNQLLASFCDHRRFKRHVTSGGLAVYVSRGQEVWLETKDYRGMTGRHSGYSIFSGFLLHPY